MSHFMGPLRPDSQADGRAPRPCALDAHGLETTTLTPAHSAFSINRSRKTLRSTFPV
jgi:hypothetical protein